MKTVGLITEYNPFHNGHKYHIDEAKRLTGASYVIVVMSGNYVQRGAPAIIDKYSRAKMALDNGADLVLELPVCYATASAEFFAYGAVALLDKLGIVDYLCFGSESGDIHPLMEAAQFLSNPAKSFDNQLRHFLKEGFTYPAARLKALGTSFEAMETGKGQALTQILTEPNNILGIEYLKALLYFQSKIKPVTIKRVSNHYHDTQLSDKLIQPELSLTRSTDTTREKVAINPVISSATAIRRAMEPENTDDFSSLIKAKSSVPSNVFQILEKNYLTTYPITGEDFSSIIKYKLLTENKRTLTEYLDITADLADRLKNMSNLHLSIAELTNEIKTKNMTLTRINRALLHILLNIKTKTLKEYMDEGYILYARILGVKKQSSHLIRKIEKQENLPIITKVSKAKEQLNPLALSMLNEDITAAHLYNQGVYAKYKTSLPNEYKQGIILN